MQNMSYSFDINQYSIDINMSLCLPLHKFLYWISFFAFALGLIIEDRVELFRDIRVYIYMLLYLLQISANQIIPRFSALTWHSLSYSPSGSAFGTAKLGHSA